MTAREIATIGEVVRATMHKALAETARVQQLVVDELNVLRREVSAREAEVAALVDRLAVVEAALLTATARNDEARR